jgi:hypothetical protein
VWPCFVRTYVKVVLCSVGDCAFYVWAIEPNATYLRQSTQPERRMYNAASNTQHPTPNTNARLVRYLLDAPKVLQVAVPAFAAALEQELLALQHPQPPSAVGMQLAVEPTAVGRLLIHLNCEDSTFPACCKSVQGREDTSGKLNIESRT